MRACVSTSSRPHQLPPLDPHWTRISADAGDEAVREPLIAALAADSEDGEVLRSPLSTAASVGYIVRDIRRAARRRSRKVPRLTMRSLLLVSVLFCLLIGAVVALVFVAVFTAVSSPSWTTSIEDHMLAAELDNLNRLASEKALLGDAVFRQTEQTTVVMSRVAALSLSRRLASSTTSPPTLYNMLLASPAGVVPGYDAGTDVSYLVSGWYACSANPDHMDDCSGVSSDASLPSSVREDTRTQRFVDMYATSLHDAGVEIPLGGVAGLGHDVTGVATFYP